MIKAYIKNLLGAWWLRTLYRFWPEMVNGSQLDSHLKYEACKQRLLEEARRANMLESGESLLPAGIHSFYSVDTVWGGRMYTINLLEYIMAVVGESSTDEEVAAMISNYPSPATYTPRQWQFSAFQLATIAGHLAANYNGSEQDVRDAITTAIDMADETVWTVDEIGGLIGVDETGQEL